MERNAQQREIWNKRVGRLGTKTRTIEAVGGLQIFNAITNITFTQRFSGLGVKSKNNFYANCSFISEGWENN